MSDTEDGEAFDFDEQLELAEKWERLLEPELGSMVWEDAERISYEEDPEAQLSGIDHVLVEREFADDALQSKIITQKYESIWYEVRHERVNVDYEWEGWVYEYDNRVILYVWLSDDGLRIVDANWLLINDAFREWFNGVKGKYPEKRTTKPTRRDGRKYYSFGVVIPTTDIPNGFIRRAPAAIGLKADMDQAELGNYNTNKGES